MSRSYRMSVEIRRVGFNHAEAVKEAAEKEWPFSAEWYDQRDGTDDKYRLLANDGDSQLCGGETEEEFADRLAAAIWSANRGYCEVSVGALFLEEVGDLHDRDFDHFKQFMKGRAHCTGCQAIVTKGEVEEHDGKFYCSDCWDERLRSTK